MLLFPALLAEIGITAKDGIPVHLLSAFPALQSPGPHALSESDGQNHSYGQGHIFGPCWKLEPIDEYEKEINSLIDEANQKIADNAKAIVSDTLNKGLYVASTQMKCNFNRADN